MTNAPRVPPPLRDEDVMAAVIAVQLATDGDVAALLAVVDGLLLDARSSLKGNARVAVDNARQSTRYAYRFHLSP